MVEPRIVMLVTKIPCNSITKRQDELLNVRVNYTYQGPAIRGRLGAVVTQKTILTEFDEIGSTRKEVYVDLPASDMPAPLYTDIMGMPLAGCEPKSGYGIKVYALDLDGKPEWGCLDVLTVTEVAEEYKGTISKKELEYDSARGAIPVSNVPQGKRGLVHIWGRNDTSQWQTLGIGWIVTDPDGVVVERHDNDWAAGLVGAGQDREFIGGRFDLSKPGTYMIGAILYMNSSNPVEVDRYEGPLCTVSAVEKEAPIITTLGAINITHNSATPKASLVRQGYCAVIMCYIEWGMTTAYGYKSPEYRLYPGEELAVDIAGLTPNTTYHFRAVAVGRCVTPHLIGYGSDMTFTTSAEVVRGFTMRVINPPAGATDWIAGAVAGGTLPYMVNRIGIYETWVWDKDVPDYAINFHLMVVDAAGHSLHSMEWDYLRLRDGKSYIYNCATHQMMET